jgi:hypothetical protein
MTADDVTQAVFEKTCTLNASSLAHDDSVAETPMQCALDVVLGGTIDQNIVHKDKHKIVKEGCQDRIHGILNVVRALVSPYDTNLNSQCPWCVWKAILCSSPSFILI